MSSVKLPWTLRIVFAIFGFILKAARRSNGTIYRPLLNFFDPKTAPSQSPRQGVVTSDAVVDSSRCLWFRVFTPTCANPKDTNMPIVFYFHGGGFALFSAGSFVYDKWCRRLARELRAVVVSVNYRLAPEHRFPCQYEDGFDAVKFVDSNFDELSVGGNPKWCFLAGDSAGGNLAHHVAVKAGDYLFGRLKFIGLIALNPFFGGEERTESEMTNANNLHLSLDLTDWYWKMFPPNGSDRDHPAVNVFGPRSSVDILPARFPTTLLFIGGFDLLRDWQRKYCEGLKKAGKEVHLVEDPNAFHVSFMFKELPEYNSSIKEIQDFMQKLVKKD
ncbi:Alpha/beta hydrolase-3 [Melia azedarach]|uniref:Alpha/beta hydrolase-3 n=1 Tax=Melia azedarach TaxID=155640 RepID=A0ACC1XSG5_MELAZ|nr:Alpha/beta hydrolase-3 [Melia azedarach]